MDTRDENLVIENKVGIAKNESEIKHNSDNIVKNTEEIQELKKQVSSNKRLLSIIVVMAIVFFIAIFINGMFVHNETGLDEIQNDVFQGDTVKEIIDVQ